jgi:hypothetical protein
MEGDLDPSHIGHLHGGPIRGRQIEAGVQSAVWVKEGLAPRIEVVQKPAGFLFAARRDAGPDHYFWRASQWFVPCFTMVPAHAGNGPLFGHAWVPMDDERTATYTFTWHPTRPITDEEVQGFLGGERTHSEIIPGAMTESMGPRYDRTREHLGHGDTLIARVRQTLLSAAMAVGEGADPPGRDPGAYRLRPHSAKLPRSVDAWAEALAEPMDARPETFRMSV